MEARGEYIVLRDVSKSFEAEGKRTQALSGVSLSVRRGEFVAIVGPSGCGKSTLLRLVAGLVPVTDGTVEVSGSTVTGPVTDLGIVFQKAVLLDWRTVIGNVLLQVELRGHDPRAYRERARTLLQAVGLAGFETARPRQLSGGMQQRAAIARALIHDAPLLLMDEPFGALDALTREQMRVDLEELCRTRGKTVVFITHSVDEAVLLSDRVFVMSARPGRIEAVYDIDLPRPRGLNARRSSRFTEIEADITALFLSRGVLRNARSLDDRTLER